MPVIIMLQNGIMPSVMEGETEEALFARFQTWSTPPSHARATLEDAKTWLAELPPPSGWYDTPEAASAAIRRRREEV